jgi:hypothetical protein
VKARRRPLHLAAFAAIVAMGLLSHPGRADGTKQQCADANLHAQELRRDGKISATREALRSCAAPSCPALVRDDCTKRLDELEKAQPTLVFEATDGKGNDVSAVTVTMDGQPFAERLGGTPLAVDPGEHTFVFQAAGQPPLEKKIVVREGEKGRLERVSLGLPAPPAGEPPSASTSTVSTGFGTSKVLAVVAGAVGVAGVGVGSAFGLIAISKKNDAENACPNVCRSSGDASKWSDAKSTGNISTIAFAVGGVALAAGVVLWVTAPSSTGPSAQVGIGPGSLQLAGTW